MNKFSLNHGPLAPTTLGKLAEQFDDAYEEEDFRAYEFERRGTEAKDIWYGLSEHVHNVPLLIDE